MRCLEKTEHNNGGHSSTLTLSFRAVEKVRGSTRVGQKGGERSHSVVHTGLRGRICSSRRRGRQAKPPLLHRQPPALPGKQVESYQRTRDLANRIAGRTPLQRTVSRRFRCTNRVAKAVQPENPLFRLPVQPESLTLVNAAHPRWTQLCI